MTIFEAHVHQEGPMQIVIGSIAAAAILSLVTVGVLLFAGDMAPPGAETVLPILLVVGFSAGALAGWLWWRARIPVRLVRGRDGTVLEIDLPRGALRVEGPFELDYGAGTVPGAEDIPMAHMEVALSKGGELLVVLTETRGIVHGTPPGWPALSDRNELPRHGMFSALTKDTALRLMVALLE